MNIKIKKILFINTGGGLGDALVCIPLFNYLNKHFEPHNIYYYATDLERYWFENKLSEYRPNNLITVKSFPKHFGFKNFHKSLSARLINKFNFDSFDIIIDNQTRYRNTRVYKKIPHKYYISPCLNYFLSKPFFLIKRSKSITNRIINYLNKIKKISEKPDYKIKIQKIFLDKAKNLLNANKKYIGFSITSGHKTRKKEIKLNEIINIANHFSYDYIPMFFLEDKYKKLKNEIKKQVPNSFFPEEKVNGRFKKPIFITALGSLTEFNISIDNGISHMLSFSNNKNFIFYNNFSEKFKPIGKNNIIYDCNLNGISIEDITSEKILSVINKHI